MDPPTNNGIKNMSKLLWTMMCILVQYEFQLIPCLCGRSSPSSNSVRVWSLSPMCDVVSPCFPLQLCKRRGPPTVWLPGSQTWMHVRCFIRYTVWFEKHATLKELIHFWFAHVRRIRQDRYNRVRFCVWRWKMLAIIETYIKDKVFVAWADEVSPGCPSLVSSSGSDIVQQQDDPDDASDSSSDCSTVAGLFDILLLAML